MVDLALPRQLHAIGQRAVSEALARRAGTVEAEHVLLAILARTDGSVAVALGRPGLYYAAFQTALDSEQTRSLAAAGIAPISTTALVATPRTAKPGWGASVRDLLRRADKSAVKDVRSGALEGELAAAILLAKLGTVPRALALAKIDRIALINELGTLARGRHSYC